MTKGVEPPLARRVQRTYLALILGNTLASSFIWGINTLFLLDAGLSNLEAFAANAFFTAGMVIFEVPTGVVADVWGRRASYLVGTLTLALATILYFFMWRLHAPFWQWAGVSALLGLGFTFFSGATEAWLVDALRFAKFDGDLDVVLGRGQMVSGIAMLAGSISGGVIAQFTNLGVPFLVRVGVLLATFVVAFVLMKDLGFEPEPSGHPIRAMRNVLDASLAHGWKIPPVRWLMLAAPFAYGAGVYAFYAAQPHLLRLSGNPKSYSIAGLAAALVAGAQIVGGLVAPHARRIFRKRTTALVIAAVSSSSLLVLLGFTSALWTAVVLIAIWGLLFSTDAPIRHAYLNDMIPSKQRATILSFDSLMGNTGGIVTQPALGRVADAYGYPASFVISGLFASLAVPFLMASRRENAPADRFDVLRAPADGARDESSRDPTSG